MTGTRSITASQSDGRSSMGGTRHENYVSPPLEKLESGVNMQGMINTVRSRLLSGFGWSALSGFSLQGSTLIAGLVLSRLLAIEEFGAYAVLVATATMVAGLAQGSVGLVSTKYVGEYLHGSPERVARILRMGAQITVFTGTCAAAILYVGAPAIAVHLLGKPAVEPHLTWIAPGVLFQAVTAYQLGALQGFGAFRAVSRVGVVAGVFHVGASCLGAAFMGIEGALAAYSLSQLTRTVLLHRVLLLERHDHQIPSFRPVHGSDRRLLWTFALPTSLAGFVTLPCLWAATVLITRQPDGLVWAALFTVCHQLRQAALQLPTLLNGVTFSVLSRLKGQGARGEFHHVFWSNVFLNVGLITLLAGTISIAATFVLSLYGPTFSVGSTLLILLMASTVPEVIAASAYQIVQSNGRMWASLLFVVIPRDLGYVALCVMLLPLLRIQGAGIAYLAAQAFSALAVIAIASSRAPDPQRT